MLRLTCCLFVFCLLSFSVVGQECLVAWQLQEDLTVVNVRGALFSPVEASLFEDTPPFTFQGAVPILLKGVECPDDLELIGETMSAADAISIPTGILPSLVTVPSTVTTDLLGLAQLELQELTLEWSNDMLSYEDGVVTALDTVLNITSGGVAVESALLPEDTTESFVGFSTIADFTAQITGSTLMVQDVNFTIPIETVQQGLPITAEIIQTGSIGGSIVSIEDVLTVSPIGE
eukprot:TRINITY_DN1900_c0_g2_i1.p1 TRINITY_DN1900_c0_g2~~TRINITY_DN1900_c0_g2_i1.p1  ORF type:complete len:233 (+),score=33.54 TRINITY_DN1900_c0_g2_i1:79-777(+)